MKTILVAVDFSDVTARVVQTAKTLAQAFGSTLHLVHVLPSTNTTTGLTAGPETGILPVVEGTHDVSEVETRLAQLSEQSAATGVQVVSAHLRGSVVDKLLEQAGKVHAEAIIVGSHGHGAVYHLVVGSVTEGLLKRSSVPVLVVPAKGG